MFHAWPKHIEVHYYYIHGQKLAKDVDLQYIDTNEKVANIFTKALGLNELRWFSVDQGLIALDIQAWGEVQEKGQLQEWYQNWAYLKKVG